MEAYSELPIFQYVRVSSTRKPGHEVRAVSLSDAESLVIGPTNIASFA